MRDLPRGLRQIAMRDAPALLDGVATDTTAPLPPPKRRFPAQGVFGVLLLLVSGGGLLAVAVRKDASTTRSTGHPTPTQATQHPQCSMAHDIVCVAWHQGFCKDACKRDGIGHPGSGKKSASPSAAAAQCHWSPNSLVMNSWNQVGHHHQVGAVLLSPWSDGLRCDRWHPAGSTLGRREAIGGFRWVRFIGMANGLPTAPPMFGTPQCLSGGAAWVSAWPPTNKTGLPPPMDFSKPGSLPGDGPQGSVDAAYHHHTVCFDVPERPASRWFGDGRSGDKPFYKGDKPFHKRRGTAVEVYKFQVNKNLAAYEAGVFKSDWFGVPPMLSLAAVDTDLWFVNDLAFVRQIPRFFLMDRYIS